MAKQKKQWQKDAIESFEQSRSFIIGEGGMRVAKKVMSDVFEIEDFPGDRDTIHAITEEKLVQGIFLAHAIAASKLIDTIVDMLKNGVLEANGDKAAELAQEMREKAELDDEEEDDEEEDAE